MLDNNFLAIKTEIIMATTQITAPTVLTAELADELLKLDAQIVQKALEYKKTTAYKSSGIFFGFSHWHISWLPLIRKLADPETKTYIATHDYDPNKKWDLTNIILVVTYKNGVLQDFWFTHITRTQTHCKNNLDDYGEVVAMTTSARGAIIYDRDIDLLLENGFVSQTWTSGPEVTVENHYKVTPEMLAKFFLKQ